MSEPPPPYNGPLTFLDYWEILRLPALFALAAIAGTWAVWYFTSVPCHPDLTQTTGCYSSEITRHIHLNLLNKMMTHAVIGGGGGGLWSYAMITRQRKAIEAERKAREVLEKQLAEERERAAEERERAAEERERAAEERERAAEERRRGAPSTSGHHRTSYRTSGRARERR